MDITALRYKRFHTSYLLGWLAGGMLVGLWVGQNTLLTNNAFWLCAALLFVLGAFRSRRWWSVVAVICAGLILGVLRGSDEQQRYAAYSDLFGSVVETKGVLSGDAQLSKNGQQKLTLTNVTIIGTHYVGEIFVTVYGKTELKRSDIVTINGLMDEGFASYAAVLKNGKVVKIERGQDIIRDIREHFAAVVRGAVIEPMASLGLGFVVGQRSTLPDELDEQLKVVGLTHIVVASGYNLTILVRFVMRLLARQSRYLALIGSLSVIVAFVLFSGMSPSMNRAVIVTVLSLLAWYVGRRFHPILLISYVAAGTAFVNPMYVWSDLGWYLSFFAFIGILVVAPIVVRALYKKRSPSSFVQLVLETLSAEVTALPLVALAFATLPVFGLVANVLVAPFIPAAMVLTALTGLTGMISTAIGTIFALPTTILIGYMIAVIDWLAALPGAQYELDLGVLPIIGWYGILASLCLFLWYRTGYNFRAKDERLEM